VAADGGKWRVAARGAASGPLDPASSAAPVLMARLEATGRLGAFDGKVTAGQDRWDEVDAAARAGGLERSVGAEVGWRPHPQINLRAGGQVGRVGLAGIEAGLTQTMTAEASVAADPDGAWTAHYQVRQRNWNDAGPKVGLPASLPFHVASLTHAGRAGPVRYEISPGALQNLSTREIAPVVSGAVAVDLGADAELSVNAGWGGASAGVGVEGQYRQVEVVGSYHF
jgi:hypothetical protein